MLVFQWPPQNLPIPYVPYLGQGSMLQLEDWMSPTTVTAAFWLACRYSGLAKDNLTDELAMAELFHLPSLRHYLQPSTLTSLLPFNPSTHTLISCLDTIATLSSFIWYVITRDITHRELLFLDCLSHLKIKLPYSFSSPWKHKQQTAS